VFGFTPAPLQPAPVSPTVADTSQPGVQPAPVAACSVPALDPITDPAAEQLEADANAETGSSVDVTGMVPAAAHALNLFESKVAAVGGNMVLKSAFRPAAYQRHLQDVWYKWMELKSNTDPGCQDLRTQVQAEFQRHHLIESQHPVAVSDHTRGLAFDATVALPQHARLGRRRLTLDSLAHLVGLLRPAIASDPVHFKYVGSLRAASVRRRNPRNA
jgi:D-alanyl-D-alanine dipeptidase